MIGGTVKHTRWNIESSGDPQDTSRLGCFRTVVFANSWTVVNLCCGKFVEHPFSEPRRALIQWKPNRWISSPTEVEVQNGRGAGVFWSSHRMIRRPTPFYGSKNLGEAPHPSVPVGEGRQNTRLEQPLGLMCQLQSVLDYLVVNVSSRHVRSFLSWIVTDPLCTAVASRPTPHTVFEFSKDSSRSTARRRRGCDATTVDLVRESVKPRAHSPSACTLPQPHCEVLGSRCHDCDGVCRTHVVHSAQETGNENCASNCTAELWPKNWKSRSPGRSNCMNVSSRRS